MIYKITTHRVTITAFIILLLTTGHAISAAETSFTVEFSVYGLRPGNYNDLYFNSEASKTEPLQFKSKQRSAKYQATLPLTDPVLRFYRKTNPPAPEGEPVMQAVGSVQITPDRDDVLLVFSEKKGGPAADRFNIYPVADSLTTFQYGMMKILNITGVEVIGMFGKHKLKLRNGQCSKPGSVPDASETLISIAAEGSTRYHLLYRNRMPIDPDCRALLILRPPVREGSLRISGHLLVEHFNNDTNP